MRSNEDKEKIISNLAEPFSVDSFLTSEEIAMLIDMFKAGKNKIYKNTGPVTVDIPVEEIKNSDLFQNILDRLKPYIGENFEVYTAFLFYVEIPHIIHNDDSFDLPMIYKGIAIPLEITYESCFTEYPSLCFFDQYYLEGPSKFFNGSKDIHTFYNKCIYEYSEVKNKSSDGISKDVKEKYLTHIRDNWLDQLTFNSAQEWKPGNAIIFDCARLHAASNFKKQGIKSKLGISIFTKLKT
jgi:hypothetical protein